MTDSTIDSLSRSLFERAATIGLAARAKADADSKRLDSLKATESDARLDTRKQDRANSGFGTPMFRGLAEVATAFAALPLNDREGQGALDLADGAARSFAASFTGASDSTLKDGGTANIYSAVVRTGGGAARIVDRLQARLAHYHAMLDASESEVDAPAKKAMREVAQRYTSLIRLAPHPESGAVPEGKKPTHNGRPARTIGAVTIKAAGAKDRKALLGEVARLYLAHGDAVLDDAVLDAVLDNGGKYAPPEAGASQVATQAADLVDSLLSKHGGASSADSSMLVMMVTTLARIARDGFTANRAAASILTAAEIAEADKAAEAAEAEALLAGATEGAGVVFGQPVAPEAPAAKPAKAKGKKGGTL